MTSTTTRHGNPPTGNAMIPQGPWEEDKYPREPSETVDDLRTTSIFTALSGLFLSNKYADMTITCNGSTFKAHRAIVCSQSSFFDKAFSAPFMEAASGTIDLPEDDPTILRRLLEFLYTGNYDDGVTPMLGRPSAISMLQPDEVADELDAATDVESPVRRRKVPRKTRNGSKHPGRWAANRYGGGDDESSEDDSDYYDRERSSAEPEEEYNEFSGVTPADEFADDAGDPFIKKSSQPKEEGNDVVDLVKKELYDARDDLFLHLRLYVMADKYEVPALKLLAQDRFYRSAEVSWEVAGDFPAVVDELYNTTLERHFAMRDIVCRLVGSQVLNEKTRERMGWVMKKHGEFAVGVMNYYIWLKEGNFEWSP
ncbi:POZ domain-containing protein [Colletotrichum falcatum]|nr:POZ domain-containing protein [Colletotrichum falcatum]